MYAAEVVILVEVCTSSFQNSQVREVQNSRESELNLDLIDELCDKVALRMVVYQQWVEKHYNT